MKFITLGELKKCYFEKITPLCGLSSDEFLSLANEAANILYNSLDNTPLLVEGTIETVADSFTLDVSEIETVLNFKVDCTSYPIVPLVETHKEDRAGFMNFVDVGIEDFTTDVRTYRLPEDLKRDSGDYTDMEVTYLARRRVPPVSCDGDKFPIQSKTALKNAMIALHHENNSDPNTADKYWARAKEEATMQEAKFRGPVYPTLSLHNSNDTEITNLV